MPLGNALQGLTTLAVIVVGSVITAKLFNRIGQPRVLAPILLGIAVATCVAACPEAVRSELISDSSRNLLEAVGTAGLLLLMFSVGTELRSFGKSEDTSLGWGMLPCVLLPIAICAVSAWPFADRLGPPGDHNQYGWLFVGIALGVTAVPVLVTILKDLGISSLTVSRVALRIAIVTDGCAWILVTALVIVTTNVTDLSIPALAVGVALLVTVTFVLPRIPEWIALLEHDGPLMVMMVVSTLAGAASTQFLGLHPAIGAVIAGFFFPARFVDAASQRTFTSMVDVLLPAFFVSAAMSVPLQELCEQASWGGLRCAAVLAVAAITSKLAAGFAFGIVKHWSWRSSAKLGVLLNCRGVTEIAIASVGFQAGLISPFAFAALCGLAIATTAATAPMYRALGSAVSDPFERCADLE